MQPWRKTLTTVFFFVSGFMFLAFCQTLSEKNSSVLPQNQKHLPPPKSWGRFITFTSLSNSLTPIWGMEQHSCLFLGSWHEWYASLTWLMTSRRPQTALVSEDNPSEWCWGPRETYIQEWIWVLSVSSMFLEGLTSRLRKQTERQTVKGDWPTILCGWVHLASQGPTLLECLVGDKEPCLHTTSKSSWLNTALDAAHKKRGMKANPEGRRELGTSWSFLNFQKTNSNSESGQEDTAYSLNVSAKVH